MIADIGHLGRRAREPRRVGIGAHEVDHVPACGVVECRRHRRHHVADAVREPPVEVAVGVSVDVVGRQVGRLHPEETSGGPVAAPLPPVTGGAMDREQFGAAQDRGRGIVCRRDVVGRGEGLDQEQTQRRRDEDRERRGHGCRDRDQPPAQAAKADSGNDRSARHRHAAQDLPQSRHERRARLRVAEGFVAVAQRERPFRLRDRTRRQCPERARDE